MPIHAHHCAKGLEPEWVGKAAQQLVAAKMRQWRLFLPFDALIGAKLTNTFQISLEGSVPIVKEYPVYNFKTELHVRLTF
jgi:hypothetical protein